ncbi:MAG TPA: septum formation initiator family protein, partial [Nocardioides sp.]
HEADLRSQIAETSKDIKALEREKRRWKDEAFIEAQARKRFGYVMPGETSYMVIDENGDPLDSPDELADPEAPPVEIPDAWWDTAWGSIEAAGNPEKTRRANTPAQKIEPEQ